MNASLRLCVKQLPSGEIVGVIDRCLDDDLTDVAPTTRHEGIYVHLSLEDADPSAHSLLQQLVRGNLPLVEPCLPPAAGQALPQDVVLLAGEPSQVESAQWGRVIHRGDRPKAVDSAVDAAPAKRTFSALLNRLQEQEQMRVALSFFRSHPAVLLMSPAARRCKATLEAHAASRRRI